MIIRRSLLLLVVLLASLPARFSHAMDAPLVTHVDPPASVLFIGNSFTFYNNAIYTHLRKFLVAEDRANRHGVFLKSMTISGAVLSDHRGSLQQMLDSRKWDIVVLQGHSREAIDPNMAPGFSGAVKEFAGEVRKQGAEPVLFMTWGYSDKPNMIGDLAPAFTHLGNASEIMVVPVGLAFKSAIEQVPGVVLHISDRIHPSMEGTYLAAAVFYSALFGKSPVDLDYDAGLEESLARRLRTIAWQTTRDYYGR